MTSLERLGIEAAGVLTLCIAFWGFWTMHNHTEQNLGAQACIQSTTETKVAAAQDNTAIEAVHAAQLQAVVDIYDEKLKVASAASAGLAQRMHNDQVRQGAVSRVGAPAGVLCSTAPESGGPRGVEAAPDPFGTIAAEQTYIDACTSDANALAGIQAGWRLQLTKTTPP
jgi:hypothetical protein